MQKTRSSTHKTEFHLSTGTASVAIKHTQQHSSCLKTCSCTPPVFNGSICWKLITFKSHHRGDIFPIELWHLESQHIVALEYKHKDDKDELSPRDPTNLKAVLVGFQNGVDLRGREDVAVEH